MKNILDKINKAYDVEATKVELGTHEVELATLQSIIKLDDAAFKLKDKSLAIVKKAKDALIDASNNTNNVISAFNKVISEVDAIEKQVKDLGLNLPNEARVARDSAVREISQFNEIKNKINSIKF
jgi:hypothetical protein